MEILIICHILSIWGVLISEPNLFVFLFLQTTLNFDPGVLHLLPNGINQWWKTVQWEGCCFFLIIEIFKICLPWYDLKRKNVFYYNPYILIFPLLNLTTYLLSFMMIFSSAPYYFPQAHLFTCLVLLSVCLSLLHSLSISYRHTHIHIQAHTLRLNIRLQPTNWYHFYFGGPIF